MKNGKQNFSMIAITAIAVGALAMTGFFAAIIGAVMLPFFLFSKKKPSVPKDNNQPKYQDNVIEADFTRIDKKEE